MYQSFNTRNLKATTVDELAESIQVIKTGQLTPAQKRSKLTQIMIKGLKTRALPLGNDFTLTDETEQVIDVTECMITTERQHTDKFNDTCEVGHVEWQYMKSYVGTGKTEWDAYKSTFRDSRKELFKMLEEKQAFFGVNVPMEDKNNPSRCC